MQPAQENVKQENQLITVSLFRLDPNAKWVMFFLFWKCFAGVFGQVLCCVVGLLAAVIYEQSVCTLHKIGTTVKISCAKDTPQRLFCAGLAK